MMKDLAIQHYGRREVQEEISKYCRGRWVGVHCEKRDRGGRPILVRYTRGIKKPLTIIRPDDVLSTVKSLKPLGPRAIYGTANIYSVLDKAEDVSDLSNVIGSTATWDIDNSLQDWELTVEVVKEIVRFLNDNGVESSLFIKWSGNGCHIHLNEGAVSPDVVRSFHPLDLAYATVRYTILSLSKRIREICEERMNRVLKVENNMDPQRLFTAPLSLHRSLDKVCICISPDDLDQFDIEWLTPQYYRHYSQWDRYVVGEADMLVEKAYNEAGPR